MHVKTGDKKLPVRYGMNALAQFGDIIEKPMNEVLGCLSDLGKLKISELLAFTYVGFVDGARYEGVECEVSGPGQVGDLIDTDPDLITKMIQVYMAQATPDDSGGDGKKK